MQRGPAALTLTGLRKTFHAGQPSARVALDGVDLALAPGDFAVVIGSNGAGKSTMLGAIAGDVAPDAGQVRIGGHDVTAMPGHRRAGLIGRVFQDPSRGTAPGLTVAENLAVANRRGTWRGLMPALPARRRHAFAAALAPLGLGLERMLDRRADLLSGGQRQALSLTMALLAQPAVLLLDEHTAALDPRTADAVMAATVRAVQQARITTLMVTHNMAHAVAYGNRLVMMHEGRPLFVPDATEKQGLTVAGLIERFHTADDKLLLVR